MKYTAAITMSLLLLGVCSARNLDMSRSQDDSMKGKDDDSSKSAQDYRREGEQSGAETQKSQQWNQVKETVSRKLKNTYQQMSSYGKAMTQLSNIPDLADPLDVGSVVDKYVFGTVSHQQVQFNGLAGAHQAALNVNANSQQAVLTISLNSAEIHGQYEASDLIRKASGDFSIKMSKNVNYVCTYSYEVQGGNVQLQHSSGQLNYESFDSHYENIGFFAQFLQNALGHDLLRTVNDKVHQELESKLHSQVLQIIQTVVQNQEHDSVERAMGESIQNAINGIQQVLTQQNGFSIDLSSDSSDNSEMVHNKLHAKIASVKLNGIEKFYMSKNQVSQENSDKIRAKVELALDRPTATAVLSLHEAHDEDSPFQKISVDFDLEKVMAELSLDKPARQSGLELRSVKTKVNRIRPVNTDKYEGRVSYLIKEKMADQMKRYIEQGLKNFIEKEISSIMSQGVLPPSQQKWFAAN